MKRSEAREKVFQIIFQMEFHNDFDSIYKRLIEENKLSGVQGEYALEVIKGVYDKKEDIDEEISKFLKEGWKLNRLPNAVKAILRLSVYEIFYMDNIPDGVSINEAVNLAKIYTDEKDVKFINGILRNIQKGKEKAYESVGD